MRKVRVKNRLCKTRTSVDDIPVRPNLAVTPAQMAKMTEQGVAVSSQIASDFNDGETNVSFDLPVDRVRGMDIVELWESEKTARQRIKSHIDANKAKYGDSTITNNSKS